MPVISDVRANKGLVEIVSGGTTLLRVPAAHFAKCPVSVEEDIDLENYVDRLAAVQLADGYEAALSSLDRSDRTAFQLASSLRRKGYVAPAVDAILERLSSTGLIDDARYARRMAESQVKKPSGIYAFKRRLRAKGISDEDAEEALACFDDAQQQQAAQRAAEKLWDRYAALPPREARAKLSQALARRGFAWDVIEAVVDRLAD